MPNLLHLPWLWLFAALSLGIVVGWLTYLLATTRWNVRLVHLAIGAGAIVALLVIARVVPARFGARLEVGVILAIVAAIGGFIGWALRDLADFVPVATRPGVTPSAVAAGSYLFRDALAGMGAGSPYMRATTGHGSPTRLRTVPSADSLAQAPVPGGYTFPRTLPFADATTSRRRPEAATATGLRRHWTHPTPAQAAAASDNPAAANDATPIGGASI